MHIKKSHCKATTRHCEPVTDVTGVAIPINSGDSHASVRTGSE